MTGLPAKAREALIVNTVLLIMSLVVAGEAECFLRVGVASGEVM